MSFNDNASLDTSRMGGGGGGGRGPAIAGGGGIIGLIITLLIYFLGGGGGGGESDPGAGAGQGQQQSQGSGFEECKTGADANESAKCRMVGGENSLYDYWSNQPDLKKALKGKEFPNPELTVYSGQVQTQCGTGSNQVGPFYCPTDQGIYIDTDFFQIMEQQLGAEDGPLAELYILAHEYGHHIQNLYGVLEESQKDPKGPESGAVRVELMADCFAGMWVQDASGTKDKDGNTLLEQPTEEQIRNALGAAKAVGDDEIQKKSGRGVNPEDWTHGSAKARQGWFIKGMKAESINQCDTFEVDDPENV